MGLMNLKNQQPNKSKGSFGKFELPPPNTPMRPLEEKKEPRFSMGNKVLGGVAIVATIALGGALFEGCQNLKEAKQNTAEASANNLLTGMYLARGAQAKGVSVLVTDKQTKIEIGCENVPNLDPTAVNPHLEYYLQDGDKPTAIARFPGKKITLTDAGNHKTIVDLDIQLGNEEKFQKYLDSSIRPFLCQEYFPAVEPVTSTITVK